MPAMLDDPTSPFIYRTSGAPPYPAPYGELPPDLVPKQVILRDRVTTASLVPFSSPHQVPHNLTAHLCDLLNAEIENGDTYPMTEPMPQAFFAPYWFANFSAVMIVGDIQSYDDLAEMEANGADWSKECLGSFYVKPNYPGRSSHVCNGGFLVSNAARNRGVGRLMGEGYLEWAPKLGYTYSVFNLVYETNMASLRIWDALGFKRIGRVKGCGNLKSHPGQYIDAIIFGRELGGEGDEYVSEERFDKIRFYLKTNSYPAGSDRAEKSRLRSAATHYRLELASQDGEEDRLMLKGKEVISDPHRQYEIARTVHLVGHGGINKTTATIADKYHWVRIKETVSAAIRNCIECKDSSTASKLTYPSTARRAAQDAGDNSATAGSASPSQRSSRPAAAGAADSSVAAVEDYAGAARLSAPRHQPPRAPVATMQYPSYSDLPVDPQIMSGMHPWETATAHAHALHGLSQGLGPDDAMQVDGVHDDMDMGGAAADKAQQREEDPVGARLREELEAQMMGHDAS